MGENRSALPEASDEKRLEIVLTTPNDEGEPVYLTGNFNHWQVRDERYRLEKTKAGTYRFAFAVSAALPEVLDYKYVRGDWNGEEVDQYGNAVANRTIAARPQVVHDHVPRWKRNGLFFRPEWLPEIRVISEQFEIPQLIRTRRIAALLPHNYGSSNRRYPVLYLQDGQNLFDDHAPFGNWAVDKKLAVMAERGLGDLIVIAIDHAEEDRIREFTPSSRTILGSGDGKKYVRFLAETLKPYVDREFRTLPGYEATGIGGSSMGGLISIYAGLMYPEVYSKLMILSPSLWVAPHIHRQAVEPDQPLDHKIYIYGGGEEGAQMIHNIEQFKNALSGQSGLKRTTIKTTIDPKGKHNEQRWGEEFPRAVEWLFFSDKTPG